MKETTPLDNDSLKDKEIEDEDILYPQVYEKEMTPEEKEEEKKKIEERLLSYKRQEKKIDEARKKNDKMTPEEKESEKMKQLDHFYKWGSDGHCRLWGNGKTIEESTRLEYGWEHDPEDRDHSYAVYIWDQRDEDDKMGDNIFGADFEMTKQRLLKGWNGLREEDNRNRP